MLTKTPFLSGFSTLLFGRAKKKEQDEIRDRHRTLEGKPCGDLALQLRKEIPARVIDSSSSTIRERVYSSAVTFWAFLGQVLSEDGSCARAVAGVQQMRAEVGLPVPSSNTASYTQARQNLPEPLLDSVQTHLEKQLDDCLCSSQLWRGFRVKSVDATTAQAPDTEANQKAYPQPNSQTPGCGFPSVQLVGLIDLCHGGLRNFFHSDCDTSELRGFEQLETPPGRRRSPRRRPTLLELRIDRAAGRQGHPIHRPQPPESESRFPQRKEGGTRPTPDRVAQTERPTSRKHGERGGMERAARELGDADHPDQRPRPQREDENPIHRHHADRRARISGAGDRLYLSPPVGDRASFPRYQDDDGNGNVAHANSGDDTQGNQDARDRLQCDQAADVEGSCRTRRIPSSDRVQRSASSAG